MGFLFRGKKRGEVTDAEDYTDMDDAPVALPPNPNPLSGPPLENQAGGVTLIHFSLKGVMFCFLAISV